MSLDEPRWGDPQTPVHDPRSPEWRDPNARPWWDNRGGPPPVEVPPAPPGPPRRTPLYLALGAAVLLLIVLGVSLAATRGPSHHSPASSAGVPQPFASLLPLPGQLPTDLPLASTPPQGQQASPAPSDDKDPVTVTEAYYADLAADQPSAAFTSLCAERQQAQPLAIYTLTYLADVATGTGVTSFTQTGHEQEQGTQASVPGTLVLADKESVPITVLLVFENAQWRVCSSDLGGVLPNPGTGGSSGGPSTGTGGVTA